MRYFVITRTSPQRAHAKVRANAVCARRTIARSHSGHRSLNLDMVILLLVSLRLARFANAPPTNRSSRPVMLEEISTIRAEVKEERQSTLVELPGCPRLNKQMGRSGRPSAGDLVSRVLSLVAFFDGAIPLRSNRTDQAI